MRVFGTSIALLFLAVAAAAQATATASPQPLQGIEPLANQLRAEWKTPGLAVGVVRDGQVVLATGYGFRDQEKSLPVTTKTIFPIGSTSKSFTALALAILNDQHKLDWDDRVREHLPTFTLADPVASERATLRDLLLHRTGLARHDLVWYSSNFTRKQLIDRLPYLAMSHDFRSTFQYNNLMYMTAGYLAGEVSGQGWEQLVRKSILDPLQMSSTNFSDAESEKSVDHALPYSEHGGVAKRIPFKPADAIGPAGGINSNIDDLLHYVLMLLANGQYDGKQIVSVTNLKEIQSPQILMGQPSRYPELSDPAYGMGWVIQTYRGHRYVWHNGGIDGFYTLIALLPDDHIGVVVLSNNLVRPPAECLTRSIFDRLLGLPPVDWDARYKKDDEAAKKAEKEADQKEFADRVPGTHPSHPLTDYAGTYENPGYGTVTIALSGDALHFTLNELSSPLEHYHYDVFNTPQGDEILSGLKLRFGTGMNGKIESVSIPLESDVSDIVFKRLAPPAPPQ